MSGVTVLNILGPRSPIFKGPGAVSHAMEMADILGVSDMDLLVGAYATIQPGFGDAMQQAYAEYCRLVVGGKATEARKFQKDIADWFRHIPQAKWSLVLKALKRKLADQKYPLLRDSAFVQEVDKALGRGETEEREEVYDIDMGHFARAVKRGEIDQGEAAYLVLQNGNHLLIVRDLAASGNAVAIGVLKQLVRESHPETKKMVRSCQTDRIERILGGSTPLDKYPLMGLWEYLLFLAEIGNPQAIQSLLRLRMRDESYLEADERLRQMEVKELERDAIIALAKVHNAGAIQRVGEWILEGNIGLGKVLYESALEKVWGTQSAVDALFKVSKEKFEMLHWLFEILERVDPKGYRYKAIESYLKGYEEERLALEAKRNVYAFWFLVKMGLLGHPKALARAAEAIPSLRAKLARASHSLSRLLSLWIPQERKRLAEVKGAEAILAFFSSLEI